MTQTIFRNIILFFIFFPAVVPASENIKKEALQVFQNYLGMHEELKAIAGTGAGEESFQYKQLNTRIDSVHQHVYLRALRKSKNYIVKSGDQELLTSFFKVVLATSYRSDNYQVFALGDMYLGQPDSVIHVYQQFNVEHRRILYQKLETGFMRVSFRNREVQNYDILRKKLLSLQPEKPH
jgi:hypothetical protein